MLRDNKAVLISIKPKWCELIANGKKTIEVRKTKPKLKPPFKCYIYQTKGKEKLIDIIKDGDVCYGETYHGKPVFIKMRENSGYAGIFGREQKVIGEFVCSKIETLHPNTVFNAPVLYSKACITREEFFEYAADDTVYFWHISDLKLYDWGKAICRLNYPHYKDCYMSCCECKYGEYAPETDEYLCIREVNRPPRSWCYVEEGESL